MKSLFEAIWKMVGIFLFVAAAIGVLALLWAMRILFMVLLTIAAIAGILYLVVRAVFT